MQTNNELILTFFLPCQSRVDQSVFAKKKKKLTRYLIKIFDFPLLRLVTREKIG
jgi:hypothetical protein